ncbi:pyrroline-5-carboxylate reductase [Candidatus Pantoea edessiphila]|uniref:Pyrroline-5-carboxylate reductase n=1 Tax=Candidatus Pantoea edessiphila TaxID=2044610 RepID=A0A2P5SXK5_9GAMM|nr:pyrroline-5-carboxylate reductase [Candidatus Pantoea edessiphila]MBK4775864.1 pyrroline-5-carboxylate reductase [Pantoea sp. Edef]PPI87032.1 pyrroline-5-carboxylate reductase [Candidatus Pantoea edessiphila]
MEQKVGFIGIGNIAIAVISGLLKSECISTSKIWIHDHKSTTNKIISAKYNINCTDTDVCLAQKVDILFLTLKPNTLLKVLKNISHHIKQNTILISVAAGITINQIEQIIGNNKKIIRAMPNINSSIGEGMTSITPNKILNQFDINIITDIFKSFGKTIIVSEELIHSVIGISSSAPAYVFIFIEAIADAAVLSGMTYSQAYQCAAQALKGSAQMLLSTKKHPGELKNMVCSPGGTTIEAVSALEQNNFRSAVMRAVQKCIKKSKKLSRSY